LWSIVKATGRPLHPTLTDVWNWPNTITFFIALRQRYDSFAELSEPLPQEHWDFPHLIKRHIERLYPGANKSSADVEVSEIES